MHRLFQLFCLIILVLLSLFACSTTKKRTVTENPSRKAFSFYYNALSDIEQGYFSAALSDLDSAIYYQPEYSKFFFVKGRVFEFLQKPDSSIKAYEHSVQLKSFYPEAWVRLGELYLYKRNYGNAATNFKKAIPNYSDSLNFYLKLGECYFRLKKYHLALDRLKDYQQLSKNPSIDLKKWQGMTNYRLNEYQRAINLLQNYLQSFPNDIEAMKYFGLAKFNLKEYDEAMSALNKALNMNDRDSEIYLYRARYFVIQEKRDDALDQLDVGLTLDSMNTDILFELGEFYFQEQKLGKSQNYLNKVVKINPNYWEAYRYLGFISERENDLEGALTNYKLFLDNSLIEDSEVRQRIEIIKGKLIKK